MAAATGDPRLDFRGARRDLFPCSQVFLLVTLELLVLTPLPLFKSFGNVCPINPSAINPRLVWIVDIRSVRCVFLAQRECLFVAICFEGYGAQSRPSILLNSRSAL